MGPGSLCAALSLLITVSPLGPAAGALCRTQVDSVDLGCLLRWDCPGASPHAAYTVQTKTQGDPWKDVAWCVWISSRSCDLSQAFLHFDLYNMIRLGVTDRSSSAATDRSSSAATDRSSSAATDRSSAATDRSSSAATDRSSSAARDRSSSAATDRSSSAATDRSSAATDRSSAAATDRSSSPATDRSSAATVWGEPVKFDYSDFAFSAPSVSLSLDGDRLSVRVQFPCAANRRCSRGMCCPLSELIDPWTSVSVYNQLNPSDYKRRTVWSQQVEAEVQFSGLTPGQHYCAVANFSFPSYTIAASPPSPPRCVLTAPPPGLQPLLVGVSLCLVVMAPILILFVLNSKRQAVATASPENQPKAQASSQGVPTHTPLPSSLPDDPCDPDPCDPEPCDLEPCDLESCDLDPCDVHLELVDSSEGLV